MIIYFLLLFLHPSIAIFPKIFTSQIVARLHKHSAPFGEPNHKHQKTPLLVFDDTNHSDKPKTKTADLSIVAKNFL